MADPPQVRLARPLTSPSSYLPMTGIEAKSSATDSAILQQAFASETSQLLWSEVLPISYQGPDTMENVRLSAEAIDMIALQPGETFSFNDIVGIRTEDKGYRPGLMYSSGALVTGIGGGICIASTQLYKAALECGFKIMERHPHSGPVSYADPGRDAAVSFGWADLRFENDSDSMLLIRAVVQGERLIVALYGQKKPGRTVEIVSEDYEEIPYQTVEKDEEPAPEGEPVVEQKPRPGFTVTTVRLFRQNGRVIRREIISRDVVLPCNKIVRVNSGESSASPCTPELRVPFETPKRETLPLPKGEQRVEGTISIPEEPQGLALPERTFSTSERTASTESE